MISGARTNKMELDWEEICRTQRHTPSPDVHSLGPVLRPSKSVCIGPSISITITMTPSPLAQSRRPVYSVMAPSPRGRINGDGGQLGRSARVWKRVILLPTLPTPITLISGFPGITSKRRPQCTLTVDVCVLRIVKAGYGEEKGLALDSKRFDTKRSRSDLEARAQLKAHLDRPFHQ
jgi:hypothetical protein